MKLIYCKILMTCLVFLSLAVAPPDMAFAQEAGETDRVYDESMRDVLDALPDSVSEYLEPDGLRGEGGVIQGFLSLFNGLLGDLGGVVREPLRLFGMLCAILALCAAISFYTRGGEGLSHAAPVSVAGSLAVSAAVSAVVVSAIQSAADVVQTAEQFVAGFIPVFTGIMISTGQMTSAALYGTGVIAAASAAASIISLFVRPMTGIMLGLAIVSGIYDSGMDSVVNGIKRAVMWVMGIITSLFIGLVGLQSLVSTRSDNMALRTTKYLVGNSIPIIGSSVSEAVGTVNGSLKVIHATVGSAGIIALTGIFLPDLLRLLLCAVAMSLAAIIGDVIGIEGLAKTIRAVKSAIDITVAVLVFYFIALSVCTAIMIRTGG